MKKHINRNQYMPIGNNFWVRDPIQKVGYAIDINNYFSLSDQELILNNEIKNNSLNLQNIDTENITHENIIIISDGWQSDIKQKILESLPEKTAILAVNGILKQWTAKRRPYYYIVNSPYAECMDYIANYLPKCIASVRTYHDFLINYKSNMIYQYVPTQNEYYSGIKQEFLYTIDDYRNSVCAALSLAYRFKAKKIVLLCCDHISDNNKPGMLHLDKFSLYPQQNISRKFIDVHASLLKNINIKHHSSQIYYNHISYIELGMIPKFFKE